MKSIYLLILATTIPVVLTADLAGDQIESLIEEPLNVKPTPLDESEDLQLMDNPESLEKELSQKYSRIYKDSLTKNENLPLDVETDNKSVISNTQNLSPELQEGVSEEHHSSQLDDLNGTSQEIHDEGLSKAQDLATSQNEVQSPVLDSALNKDELQSPGLESGLNQNEVQSPVLDSASHKDKLQSPELDSGLNQNEIQSPEMNSIVNVESNPTEMTPQTFDSASNAQSVSQSQKAMDDGLETPVQTGLTDELSTQLSEKNVALSNALVDGQNSMEASPADQRTNAISLDNAGEQSITNDEQALEEMNNLLDQSGQTQDLDEDHTPVQEMSDLDMFNSQIEASKDEFEKSQLDSQSPIVDMEDQMNEDGNEVHSSQEVLSQKTVVDKAVPMNKDDYNNAMNEMKEETSEADMNSDLSQDMEIHDVQSQSNLNSQSQKMETPDQLDTDLNQDLHEAQEVASVESLVHDQSQEVTVDDHVVDDQDAKEVSSIEHATSEDNVPEASPVLDTEEPVIDVANDQNQDVHEVSHESVTRDVDQNAKVDEHAKDETSHKSVADDHTEGTVEVDEPMTDDMEGMNKSFFL